MDESALRQHLEALSVQLARRILHRCGSWPQGITVTVSVVIGTRKPRGGIAKDLPSVAAASTFSKACCRCQRQQFRGTLLVPQISLLDPESDDTRSAGRAVR